MFKSNASKFPILLSLHPFSLWQPILSPSIDSLTKYIAVCLMELRIIDIFGYWTSAWIKIWGPTSDFTLVDDQEQIAGVNSPLQPDSEKCLLVFKSTLTQNCSERIGQMQTSFISWFLQSWDVDKGEERRLFLTHDGLLVLARHVVPLGTVLKKGCGRGLNPNKSSYCRIFLTS